MAYAILTDITTIYGPNALYVADRDGDGAAETGAVDRALQSASDEIDSYLAVRYQLPLAETPGMLVQACVDIAVYRLAQTADVLSDELRRRYDDTIAFLKRIADGKAALVFTAATPPVTTPDGQVITGAQPIVAGGPPRLFTRDALRDI